MGVGERTEMAADGSGDRWQWRQMAVGDQIRFETRREGAYGGSDSATTRHRRDDQAPRTGRRPRGGRWFGDRELLAVFQLGRRR